MYDKIHYNKKKEKNKIKKLKKWCIIWTRDLPGVCEATINGMFLLTDAMRIGLKFCKSHLIS